MDYQKILQMKDADWEVGCRMVDLLKFT
uniref:Uncharacterized protein n=1 Tax=Arundo donax TaxID=35708 RepID=A0A0A9GRR6_ARUDO